MEEKNIKFVCTCHNKEWKDKHALDTHLWTVKNKKRHNKTTKEWGLKNPEKKKANNKSNHLKNREKRLALSKNWYFNNKEKNKKQTLNYYYENKEECLMKNKKYEQENKAKLSESRKKYFASIPGLFSTLKAGAKKRKVGFTILFEDFEKWYLNQTQECYYCKRSLEKCLKDKDTKGITRLTFDRKNNKIGYTIANLALACFRCNDLKSNYFTEEEMLEIGKIIYRKEVGYNGYIKENTNV